MASDSDEREFISIHKPTGSWICEHAGEVHAISFAIPVEQEEQHGIGLKISDPRKAGIHYLFVLAPNDPKNWYKKPNNTKFRVFGLNEIGKTKSAKKVKVALQQTSTGPLQMPRGPLPTLAPKEAYMKDPAVVVTATFPRMTIDVKVSDKALPRQTFAYPALFRIDAPTIGKPSLKLLWGRYDPENPAFDHILRTESRKTNTVNINRFTTLTEEGKRDKFARQFDIGFKFLKNTTTLSMDGSAFEFSRDPHLFKKVIYAENIEEYRKLAFGNYKYVLDTAGLKVADKDFFRKTFLHFITEHIEQTQ